jgi:hypothetical protein
VKTFSNILCILIIYLICCINHSLAGEKLAEITAGIRQKVQLEEAAIGIRPEEHEAYYDVLRKLIELPVGELERGARTFLGKRFKKDFSQGIPRELPVYAQMHFHIKEFQGEPVVLRGHTQRIIPVDIDPPIAGLTRMYEIWLYTADSQYNPTVVIAPGLPEKYQTGDMIQDHLKVSGVLFKKYIYKAQDQVRFAPLIMAGELSYDPPTYRPLIEQPVTIIITVIFLLLFMSIVAWILYAMKRPVSAQLANLGLPETLAEFENDNPSVEVHEKL